MAEDGCKKTKQALGIKRCARESALLGDTRFWHVLVQTKVCLVKLLGGSAHCQLCH
jgi:hypothetical protein